MFNVLNKPEINDLITAEHSHCLVNDLEGIIKIKI